LQQPQRRKTPFAHLPELTAQLRVEPVQALLDRSTEHDILLGGLRPGNWVGEVTDLSKPPLADVEPIAAIMRADDNAPAMSSSIRAIWRRCPSSPSSAR
jgi:hypothetical protein